MIDIQVDQDTCFGSGECVLAAPSVFELDDVGIARLRADASSIDADAARRIADNCPSGAIHVAEAAGAELQPGR